MTVFLQMVTLVTILERVTFRSLRGRLNVLKHPLICGQKTVCLLGYGGVKEGNVEAVIVTRGWRMVSVFESLPRADSSAAQMCLLTVS